MMKEGGGDAGQRGVQGKEAQGEKGKYFRAIICIIRGNPLSCRQLIFRLMELQSIWTVARYEAKLLRRSWLFRVFAVVATLAIFCLLTFLCTPLAISGISHWGFTALSGQVPFFATWLATVVQAVMVVFLAGGIAARGRKMDTLEVIFARPVGNGEYVWGKVAGTLRVFGVMLAVVLAMTLFLHVAVAKSPFSLAAYVWYPLTLALPCFMFVLGLTLAVNHAVQARALALVVLIGILGLLYFYLKEAGHGVLDLFGQQVPAMGSDVTGLAEGGMYLLQRGMWFVAGVGLILLSAAAFRRLPNGRGKAGYAVAGSLCLAVAAGMGCGYVGHYRQAEARTAAYGEVYDRYAGKGQVHVAEHRLAVTLAGERLEGRSELAVVNPTGQQMERVVLYLNPGLEVERVACGGQAAAFSRDGQAVLVEQALKAGDTLRMELAYSGGIDEAVCYTDVAVEGRRKAIAHEWFFHFGKRYAWLTEEFVQLTPECLWYPTGTAAAHPAAPFDLQRDFTHYELEVRHPEGLTVISQGEARREAGRTVFTNGHALPCLSLTAGHYERMGVEVDSVLYEVYCFRGHGHFREPLAALRDTMPYIIRSIRHSLEYNWVQPYPFEKFVLAETPAAYSTYLRNQQGYSEHVMPEVMFLPERGYNLNYGDFNHNIKIASMMLPPEHQDSIALATQALRQFLDEITGTWAHLSGDASTLEVKPLFTRHTAFIRSEEYPILNLVLQKALEAEITAVILNSSSMPPDIQANLYLKEHSLGEAIADGKLSPQTMNAIIQAKSLELQDIICQHIPAESYQKFTRDFFRRHAFEAVPYATFCEEILRTDSIDLDGLVREWYHRRGTPAFILRDMEVLRVTGQERESYQIRFKVYNPSETDGFLSLRFMSYSGAWTERLLVPAGQAYEFRIPSDGLPSTINLKTNLSQNIPSATFYQFRETPGTTRDTASGRFPISPEAFQPAPGEIIVDNEDAGFSTQESQQRHKLKDLLRKKPKETPQYTYLFPVRPEWTATSMDCCYGDIVRSAMFKKKGTGQATATWRTELPEEGYYEISVWNARDENSYVTTVTEEGKEEKMGRGQRYTVQAEGQEAEEPVIVDMEAEKNDWVSLGQFYLPAGEVSVTLTDETEGIYVIADAIKFRLVQ